jgi:hypothetical protein
LVDECLIDCDVRDLVLCLINNLDAEMQLPSDASVHQENREVEARHSLSARTIDRAGDLLV